MLRRAAAIETAPRWRSGHPPHRTTGVASASSIQARARRFLRAPGALQPRAPPEVACVDPGEEALHGGDDEQAPHGGEEIEGVLRAREFRVDERRTSDAAEGGREAARLLDRDERVVRAVQDEEGWRIGPQAGER